MIRKHRSYGRNNIFKAKIRPRGNKFDFEFQSKSVENIKYGKLSGSSDIRRQSSEHDEALKVRFDFFDSLQSLFNEKRVIDFSKVNYLKFHTEGIKNFQPNILIKKDIRVTVSDAVEKVERNYFDTNDVEHLIKMDDEKNLVEEEKEENSENILQEDEPAIPIISENSDETAAVVVNNEEESIQLPEGTQKDDENDAELPRYPLPDELNQGIPMKPGGRTDSIQSSVPMSDAAVMNEMKIASERCRALDEEITELKSELKELQQKPVLSDEDRNIFDKKREKVMEKMGELESITRKIQNLIGLTDPTHESFAKAFEMFPFPHERNSIAEEYETENITDEWNIKEIMETENLFDLPQPQYAEDSLPRVIVCGYTEERIPKIVVADSLRGTSKTDRWQNLGNVTLRLTDELNFQEKNTNSNDDNGGCTYRKLGAIRPEENNTVDILQQKVCGLQTELQILVKENEDLRCQIALLNEKVGISFHKNETCRCTRNSNRQYKKSICDSVRLSGGGSEEIPRFEKKTKFYNQNPTEFSMEKRGNCPAEIQNKLDDYEINSKHLKCQLENMESEIQHMKMEFSNVQRERQQLDQQRKLLICSGPCAPCPCSSSLHTAPSIHQNLCSTSPICQDVCASQKSLDANSCSQQQIGDLREKYSRLQEDYKNKLCEVSCLRRDAEKLKQESREAKNAKDSAINQLTELQERVKSYEKDNKNKYGGGREETIEQEQALIVSKQRYREAQEELEELRLLLEDQSYQLEDYRNKYLQAQEQVEEQKRLLDLMEIDNARMNENVTLEIGRVKNQFQEKLAELAPLPDLLRNTQIMLQESQQQRINAERSCEDMSRQLANCKEKLDDANSQLEKLQNDIAILNGEKGSGTERLDDIQTRNNQLENENERMRNELTRLETDFKGKIEEKLHEIVQLRSMLEELREDSARQVARIKERCETIRKNMQTRISDLENELAKCRALSKSAEKERDEIRIKMQSQINRLNESFDQAQGRVKTLQGHVDYLKTSYSNVFAIGGHGEGQPNSFALENPSQSPYDSCDCTY